MKIAILGTRGIPNQYGGFEQFAEHLSVGLIHKGHEVFVYNSHNHLYKECTWNGVNIVHCYDPEYLIGTIGQFIYDFNCILNSRKHDFEIILQLGYTSSSIWNFLFKKRSMLVTNMDGLEWKRSKFSTYAQRFLKYAESLAVKYSDYFISDSLGIQQYLEDKYDIKSTYIPYGAELMDELDLDIFEKYNIKKYKYDILIARMEPENNIEMILTGYLDSKKERDLVVVGNLTTKFGKYISEKYNDSSIKYLGFISGVTELNTLRNYSNVYFHGHSVGGTNPSLLEAMASNSLICAHDNVFNKSILDENGYYFKSSSDVTEIIKNISKNEKEQNKLNSNRKKIKTIYSWEKIVNSYHDFFNENSLVNNN